MPQREHINSSSHNITTPHWKARQLLEFTHSWLHSEHNTFHCYIITFHPSINNNQNRTHPPRRPRHANRHMLPPPTYALPLAPLRTRPPLQYSSPQSRRDLRRRRSAERPPSFDESSGPGPTPTEEFDPQSEFSGEVEGPVEEAGDGEEFDGGDCWGL